MKNPYATLPPFNGTTLIEHIHHAVLILRVHGLMSDSERDKVRARLEKALAKYERSQDGKGPTPC